jgi:hypothetical protein
VSPREPPDKQFERVDILDAMAQATVPEDGDAIEKATWPALAPFFPHYEETGEPILPVIALRK